MKINLQALRRFLMPVLILSIVLTIGCRGCSERDDTFPQAGGVPAIPEVTTTTPDSDDTDVALNSKISVTFNTPMVEATVGTSTFTLSETAGGLVDVTATYTGLVALFTPKVNLTANTSYTATVNSTVRSVAGNTMAKDYTWSFTTGSAIDIIRPTVVSTSPISGAVGVAANAVVSVPFSEVMDPTTINATTFHLTEAPLASLRAQITTLHLSVPGGLVDGTVSYIGKTAFFTPSSHLKLGTTYTAVVTTGVKDLAGNAMAENHLWSFTAIVADTTAPTVSATDPASNQAGVAINTKIAVTFSELMKDITINNLSFKVEGVEGTVIYDPLTKIATFKPKENLTANKLFTATITTAAQDLAGNAIVANYNWSFTTGATADNIAPTVLSTVPVAGAVNSVPEQKITAVFSEGMESSTINGTTFTVKGPGGVTVVGVVTYVGTTATFVPAGFLANSTTYDVNIATGVKDLAGNAMAAAKPWSFTTGAAAPTVTLTDPLPAATKVAINKSISATFSGIMNPTTVNTTTFTLKTGGIPVAGTVSYAGFIATFKPTVDLAPSTIYTATITTGAKDLAGNAIAAEKSWSFTTGAAADLIPPTVISTNPAEAETGVATSRSVAAIFNEGMDPATITDTTFTLSDFGGIPVTGTVTYIGTTATFKPDSQLSNSSIYTARITTGAKDLAGNAIAAEKSWSFTTGAAPGTTAPTVTSTDPLNAATAVATDKSITAVFSKSMNPATLNNTTFTLKKLDGTSINGVVNYFGTTVTFIPTGVLANSTTYVANITLGVKDLSGNSMAAAKTWTFVTGAAPDTTAPTVTVVYPANLAENIGCKEAITATFNEHMEFTTIYQTSPKVTFRVTGLGVTPVSGVVSYNNRVAKFTPDNDLPDSTIFTVTIATQATDLAGNELVNPKVWTFKTGQSLPVLGRASSFALMATTAISGTTGSIINGDVGVSPSGLTSMTLSPVEIKGSIYSGTDVAIVNAIADLKVAYDTVKLKATNVVTVPKKDLGGETFGPGLYITGDTFHITAGDLTLDAQGNENAVFIFQMPETLTVAVGRHVVLINGAKASNIYWQVGSSATLNTTTIFKGNILANVSITVNSGSIIEGRLLAGAGTAGAGAVVFDSSTITIPAP